MEAREHLFYGLGIIAYAVANADGKIQHTERNELHDIVREWGKSVDVDFDVTEIIFSIMRKDKPSLEDGFEMGMKYIRLGKEFLNEKMKERFVYLIEDIAHAFPPVTREEESIIKRFAKELHSL